MKVIQFPIVKKASITPQYSFNKNLFSFRKYFRGKSIYNEKVSYFIPIELFSVSIAWRKCDENDTTFNCEKNSITHQYSLRKINFHS